MIERVVYRLPLW